MKLLIYAILQCWVIAATAQQTAKPNVFIITTDGLRWQEVFNGADEKILLDKKFVQNSELCHDLYGGLTAEERRKRLMPFFWSTIAAKGQLHGNRNYNNKVDVSNIYKISYPGYNEILTGYADPFLAKNKPVANKNTSLLEYLNGTDEYRNKVVAFSSWDVFPAILNVERSGIPVNTGYGPMKDAEGDYEMINKVQENLTYKTGTRYDLLTFLNAKEYLQVHHPKVMLLGLGETDEFGHQKQYDRYLQQANNVDKMIAELWYFVQSDDFYKNNTYFIITTDHGRGSRPGKWYSHNILVKGSSQAWLAMIGPGIKGLGEIKQPGQLYQRQLAATVAGLLHEDYEANHPIADAFTIPVKDDGPAQPDLSSLNLNGIYLPISPINLLLLACFFWLVLYIKKTFARRFPF